MRPKRSFGNFSGSLEATISAREWMIGKPRSHSVPGRGWPGWMHSGRASEAARHVRELAPHPGRVVDLVPDRAVLEPALDEPAPGVRRAEAGALRLAGRQRDRHRYVLGVGGAFQLRPGVLGLVDVRIGINDRHGDLPSFCDSAHFLMSRSYAAHIRLKNQAGCFFGW